MKVDLSSMMTKGRSKGSGRGIKVVRERYSDLNQLIGDLSSKLSEVSSSIDNEFLSAYRVHMVDVQEDLKSLKQQVSPTCNDKFVHSIDINDTNLFMPCFVVVLLGGHIYRQSRLAGTMYLPFDDA